MEEAFLWSRESGKVRCELCAWRCLISDGDAGYCGVRVNKKGVLYSKNYGKILFMDKHRIEKLPMFHFYPDSETLSLSSFGCNMKCKFCRNADLSQKTSGMGDKYAPEEIIKLANKKGVKIISFTCSEPTVNFEFAFKVARLAKRYNIKTVFVTNGYMTSDAIKKIGKYLDAVTVDVKASGDPEFYKKYMEVESVQPIFDALKSFKKHRVFTEVSNLIVPEIGESREYNRELLEWIINNLGSSIPYHLLAFMPAHKMLDTPETGLDVLEEFASEAKRIGLRYVYTHDSAGISGSENTYCYNCGVNVIERTASKITKVNLVGNRCPNCGFKIDLVKD